jgi:hypothetical protein
MDDLIWESTLDGRYHITVTRISNGPATGQGMFRIHHGEQQLMEQQVALAYDAPFGPDVADVSDWEDMAVVFIDSHLTKP